VKDTLGDKNILDLRMLEYKANLVHGWNNVESVYMITRIRTGCEGLGSEDHV